MRNAEFFGLFKETAYTLAHRHNAFWTSKGILKDSDVSRMMDAELVSILIATMIDGIRQTKKKDLYDFYEKYDDEFRDSQQISDRFETIINLIGDSAGDVLASTSFKRIPLFYSLFVLIFDAKYGLKNAQHAQETLDAGKLRQLSDSLVEISEKMRRDPVPSEVEYFTKYSKYSTADVGSRKARHQFLWKWLFGSEVQWVEERNTAAQ